MLRSSFHSRRRSEDVFPTASGNIAGSRRGVDWKGLEQAVCKEKPAEDNDSNEDGLPDLWPPPNKHGIGAETWMRCDRSTMALNVCFCACSETIHKSWGSILSGRPDSRELLRTSIKDWLRSSGILSSDAFDSSIKWLSINYRMRKLDRRNTVPSPCSKAWPCLLDNPVQQLSICDKPVARESSTSSSAGSLAFFFARHFL